MIKYSNRMTSFETSVIREILKITADPSIISFAGGLPASELFPVEAMQKVMKTIMSNDGGKALQYSTSEGNGDLRDKIAKRLSSENKHFSRDNILITSGSQQGLDLSGKIFLNPGDIVVCESPSYLGALNAFKAYECKFLEIDTDDDGMIMEDLKSKLERTNHIKCIYVVPDFQNPSGRTWSKKRRIELLKLAKKYDLPIIEDSPYSELRFEGHPEKAIMDYDEDNRVIYLGTFSKTFSPGLRIGWVCASKEILAHYIKCKQGADLHTNTLSQLEVNLFLETNDFDKHIQKIVEVYKTRRDLMYKTMKECFPKEVSFEKPEGGLFIWVTLPESIDARDIFDQAIKEKVAFVPGESFFPVNKHKNYMRMNFSCMNEAQIEEGVKRLGKVLKKAIT